MFRFIFGRLAVLIPTFIGVSLIAFSFIRLLPGDPVMLMSGERVMSPERHAELMHQLGLDRPMYIQYFDYLGGLDDSAGVPAGSIRPRRKLRDQRPVAARLQPPGVGANEGADQRNGVAAGYVSGPRCLIHRGTGGRWRGHSGRGCRRRGCDGRCDVALAVKAQKLFAFAATTAVFPQRVTWAQVNVVVLRQRAGLERDGKRVRLAGLQTAAILPVIAAIAAVFGGGLGAETRGNLSTFDCPQLGVGTGIAPVLPV